MPSSLRKQALRIFRAALEAADPVKAVRRHVRLERGRIVAATHRYRLDEFQNIYVVGAGKASARMAAAVEAMLGRRITGGLINAKYGHRARLQWIELNECGHPIPDRNGEIGAARIAQIASQA